MEDSFTDTGVQTTPEYNQLINTLLATELRVNTAQILYALEDESNNVPFEIINPEVKKGNGIFVENDKEGNMVRANVLDNANDRILYVDMSTLNDNPDWLPISQETFDKLKQLAKDPQVCMLNVKTKLEKAK